MRITECSNNQSWWTCATCISCVRTGLRLFNMPKCIAVLWLMISKLTHSKTKTSKRPTITRSIFVYYHTNLRLTHKSTSSIRLMKPWMTSYSWDMLRLLDFIHVAVSMLVIFYLLKILNSVLLRKLISIITCSIISLYFRWGITTWLRPIRPYRKFWLKPTSFLTDLPSKPPSVSMTCYSITIWGRAIGFQHWRYSKEGELWEWVESMEFTMCSKWPNDEADEWVANGI